MFTEFIKESVVGKEVEKESIGQIGVLMPDGLCTNASVQCSNVDNVCLKEYVSYGHRPKSFEYFTDAPNECEGEFCEDCDPSCPQYDDCALEYTDTCDGCCPDCWFKRECPSLND